MMDRSTLVRWYRANAWLPVMASTMLLVATAFMNTGGNSAVLSLAAGIGVAIALALLGAVKIAEYVGSAGDATARQRGRNIAIALALGAFAVLFYAATIVRMGGDIAKQAPAVAGSASR